MRRPITNQESFLTVLAVFLILLDIALPRFWNLLLRCIAVLLLALVVYDFYRRRQKPEAEV